MNRLIITLLITLVSHAVVCSQPQDMVPVTVTVNTTPSPGGYYLAPNCRLANPPYAPYFMMLGNDGVPKQWKKLTEYPFDSRVLPDGRLGYSVFQSAGTGPRASSTLHRLDSSLNALDTLAGGNGYNIAMHGFDVLANGNRLIICQENQRIDMSKFIDGGHPAADVQQMLVQEITPQGTVIFQFRTLDHLPITASYEDLKAASIRPFHLNAIAEDHDGNFLMSIRHCSMVIKVNRSSGEVMWILGGKLNQFSFKGENEANAPTYFSYQHDIRRLANGNITLFDNGTQRTPQYSRGVEYKIDEVAKTCELVWEYRHVPDIYASLQGAMQTLPDGHRVIAWGSGVASGLASFTEVDAEKNVVFEAFMHKDMFPYSVTKHAVPPGRPTASVFIDEILQGNTYEYNKEGGDSIGMTVEYTNLVSFFYNATEAKLFPYAPRDPVFDGGYYPRLLPVHISMVQEGMESHYGQFRFRIEQLGITQQQAPRVSVWRRDTIGIGTLRKQRTRYNPNSREIIVDSMSIGEFAFGFDRDTVRSVQPARLLSPIAGKRIGIDVNTPLRFSPQGLATHHNVVVKKASDQTIVYDRTVTADRSAIAIQEPGVYIWYVASSYKPTAPDSITSAIDSFVVTQPYVDLLRPSSSVVWTKDSAYAISWETNVPGSVIIELVQESGAVTIIAENVPATHGGFLWRIPVSVEARTDYRIVIRTIPTSGSGAMISSSFTVEIREPSVGVPVEVATTTTIAPNPSSDRVYVGGKDGIQELALYDISGVQILREHVHGTGHSIDVSAIAPGMYTLLLVKQERTEHHRLLIVR